MIEVDRESSVDPKPILVSGQTPAWPVVVFVVLIAVGLVVGGLAGPTESRLAFFVMAAVPFVFCVSWIASGCQRRTVIVRDDEILLRSWFKLTTLRDTQVIALGVIQDTAWNAGDTFRFGTWTTFRIRVEGHGEDVWRAFCPRGQPDGFQRWRDRITKQIVKTTQDRLRAGERILLDDNELTTKGVTLSVSKEPRFLPWDEIERLDVVDGLETTAREYRWFQSPQLVPSLAKSRQGLAVMQRGAVWPATILQPANYLTLVLPAVWHDWKTTCSTTSVKRHVAVQVLDQKSVGLTQSQIVYSRAVAPARKWLRIVAIVLALASGVMAGMLANAGQEVWAVVPALVAFVTSLITWSLWRQDSGHLRVEGDVIVYERRLRSPRAYKVSDATSIAWELPRTTRKRRRGRLLALFRTVEGEEGKLNFRFVSLDDGLLSLRHALATAVANRIESELQHQGFARWTDQVTLTSSGIVIHNNVSSVDTDPFLPWSTPIHVHMLGEWAILGRDTSNDLLATVSTEQLDFYAGLLVLRRRQNAFQCSDKGAPQLDWDQLVPDGVSDRNAPKAQSAAADGL